MANVALVVLDTLRKDTFDRHFEWLPGKRFEGAYSTANWTVPAHASLFTGRYASEVGVHAKHLHFDCPEPALAEHLRGAGYRTRAFSANTSVTGHFEFDRGFDEFEVADGVEASADDSVFAWREFSRATDATGARKVIEGIAACVSGDCATLPSLRAGVRLKLDGYFGDRFGGGTRALETVRGTDFGEREFLFLNLMETHEPYRAPPEYMRGPEPDLTDAVGPVSLGDVDGQRVRRAYGDCARYLSDVYAEIFRELEADFDYVVTLSDHGELLGEHDGWGHEFGVYPELTRIPLVVSGNGLGGTCRRPVNLLDVHRTILNMAGIEAPSRGEDLLGDGSGTERITEYHGLTPWSRQRLDDHGYEERREALDRELRGYATRDYYGYETQDGFVETGPRTIEDPRGRLDAYVDRLDARRVDGDTEIPDDVRDRLSDLGYA